MAGDQPKTERPFGLWIAISLVVGLMVGTGIFSLPAQLADFGWAGIAAWVIAGAGTVACAIPLVRLIAARPQETGLMAICGSVLGPWIGAANAWAYWVSLWCANAVVSTVAVQYGTSLLPGFQPSTFQIGVMASALLVVNSLQNLRGARAAGRMQVLLTALKVLPFAAVLIMLLQIALWPQQRFAGVPLTPLHTASISPAVTLAFFALLGFECAGLVAERVRDPERNIVRATLMGMSGAAALYLVVCTGIVAAVPRAELAASSAPVALFAGHMWGAWAAALVALSAALSGFGAMNAQTLLLGELPLGMARAGQLPAWVARVNRHDVAAVPLVIGNVLAVLLLLGSATAVGADVLAFLLKVTTAVSIWLYVVCACSAIKLGLSRAWAVAGIAFCLFVIYGAGLAAGGLAILLMLAGLPLYAIARRITPTGTSRQI